MKNLSNTSFKWLLLYLFSGCIITFADEREDFYMYESEEDSEDFYIDESEENSWTTQEVVSLSVVGGIAVVGIIYIFKKTKTSIDETEQQSKLKFPNNKLDTSNSNSVNSLNKDFDNSDNEPEEPIIEEITNISTLQTKQQPNLQSPNSKLNISHSDVNNSSNNSDSEEVTQNDFIKQEFVNNSRSVNIDKNDPTILEYAKKAQKNTMLGKLYEKKEEKEAKRFFDMVQEQLDASRIKKVNIVHTQKNDGKEPIKWTIINGTGLEFKAICAENSSSSRPYYRLYLIKDDKEHFITPYSYDNAVISIFATENPKKISFSYCDLTNDGHGIQEVQNNIGKYDLLDREEKEKQKKLDRRYRNEKFDTVKSNKYHLAFSPTNNVDERYYLRASNKEISHKKPNSKEQPTTFELERENRSSSYRIKEADTFNYLRYNPTTQMLELVNDDDDDDENQQFSIIVEKKLKLKEEEEEEEEEEDCKDGYIVSIKPFKILYDNKSCYIQHLILEQINSNKLDDCSYNKKQYTQWRKDEKNALYLNTEEDIIEKNKRTTIDDRLDRVGESVVRKIGKKSYIDTPCLGIATYLANGKNEEYDNNDESEDENEEKDESEDKSKGESFVQQLIHNGKKFDNGFLDSSNKRIMKKKEPSYKLMAATCDDNDQLTELKEVAKEYNPELLPDQLELDERLAWAIFILNALFPKKLQKFKKDECVAFGEKGNTKFATIGKKKKNKEYRHLISVSTKYHGADKFIIRLATKQQGVYLYLFAGFEDWERPRMQEAALKGTFISIKDESTFKMPEIEIAEKLDLTDSFEDTHLPLGVISDVKENIKITVNATGVFVKSEVAIIGSKGGSSGTDYIINDKFTMMVAHEENILVEADINEEKFLVPFDKKKKN